MALKDLLSLVDDKLADVFNQKPHDPTKARSSIIKGIDRTANQFTATEPQRGRKWFSVKNSVVRFAPGFEIGGKSEHFVPSERFPDYLTALRGAVEAGELDDAIQGNTKAAGGRAGKRGGWSPERRAAFEAKRKK